MELKVQNCWGNSKQGHAFACPFALAPSLLGSRRSVILARSFALGKHFVLTLHFSLRAIRHRPYLLRKTEKSPWRLSRPRRKTRKVWQRQTGDFLDSGEKCRDGWLCQPLVAWFEPAPTRLGVEDTIRKRSPNGLRFYFALVNYTIKCNTIAKKEDSY